jgi:hypothetical protein
MHAHRLEALRALLTLVDTMSGRDRATELPVRRVEARPPRPPPSGEPRFSVQVLRGENRLALSLRGLLEGTDVREFARSTEHAFARLQPGFSALLDLSSVGMVRPDAAAGLRTLAAVFEAAGLSRLVMVLGPPPATLVARCLEGPYATRVATSVEDAERLFDGPRRAAPRRRVRASRS